MEMMLPYRKEFQVAAQDVDVTRHQTLPAFGSWLLNTAGQAADQLGVGALAPAPRNGTFAVGR